MFSIFIANNIAADDEMLHVKVLLFSHFILNPLYLGGLIYLLLQLSRQKQVNIQKCVVFGFYNWFPLFLVSVLYGVLTGIGLFMFVLPGIWIFIRLILAPFLVVIDKTSPLDAVGESFALTKNEFWNILGLSMLVFLLLLLLQQFMFQSLPETTLAQTISSIVGDILWSFLTIIWFRYYDLLKNEN